MRADNGAALEKIASLRNKLNVAESAAEENRYLYQRTSSVLEDHKNRENEMLAEVMTELQIKDEQIYEVVQERNITRELMRESDARVVKLTRELEMKNELLAEQRQSDSDVSSKAKIEEVGEDKKPECS